MQSQQVMWQGRGRELPTSSKQQPGASAQRRPIGIPAGLAAVVLTALAYGLILSYAAVSALAARHGYAEMSLRQEIEDLHAQLALLSYQVDVAKSDASAEQAAERLDMRPADAVREVDYVLLPLPEPGQAVQSAEDRRTASAADLAGTLAGLAAEVVNLPGGRAEASMVEGHRR